jgi:hypothetical protein
MTSVAAAMKRYRAFVLTFEGNVVNMIKLHCANEAEAIERAKALVADGRSIELWEGPRRIARFIRWSSVGYVHF